MAKCGECAWWERDHEKFGFCECPLPDWAGGHNAMRETEGADCPQFKEREDGER